MPSITSISPDKFDTGKSVTLSGSGFGSSQGSVLIAGAAQTVTSWSDTSVTFTAARGSQSPGGCRIDLTASASPPPIHTAVTVSGWGQSVNAGGTITGPAPLAVFVDATATTHDTVSDPFRECGYHHDFGYATPTTPGSWTHSSKPKGNQVGGPISAHVYETPGTYTLSVRGQDANGYYEDVFVTVVVQDPDVVYAGSATVCISSSGNFSGAPSGAGTQTSIPTVLSSNTRYLFRRGESFTGTACSIAHSKSRIHVGSFGSGAYPLVKLQFATRPPKNSETFLHSVAVYTCSPALLQVPFADYTLFHKCTHWGAPASGGSIEGGSTVQYYFSAPTSTTAADNSRWSKYCVWSECAVNSGPLAEYCIYAHMVNAALLGISTTSSQLTHVARFPLAYKFLMAHCQLDRSASNRHQWKLHSRGRADFAYLLSVTTTPLSQYVIAADNVVTPDINDWQFVPAPQNAQSDELVKDVILERNAFASMTGAPAGQRGAAMGGIRVTARDNTFSSWPSSQGFGIDTHNGVVTAEEMQPYYLPSGNSWIDSSQVFAAPSSIIPNKAGT